MALPIPSIPQYNTILPISKKVVKYRPFLVKEEKIILLALTSDDPDELISAMKQVISLTADGLNPDDLSITDLNYLLIKIRTASKGSEIELALKCKNKVDGESECGYVNEISVDLSKAKINQEMPEAKIEINGSIGIQMKPVTLALLSNYIESDTETDAMMKVIIGSIDFIYDGDNITSRNEFSEVEAIEFLDNLTHEQMAKIMVYVNNQPKIKIDIDYECGGCGIKKEIEVDNIQDFLG